MMLPAVMFYSMIFCLQCCKQLDLLYGGSWDSEACRRGACNRHRGGWKEEEPQDTAPGEEET